MVVVDGVVAEDSVDDSVLGIRVDVIIGVKNRRGDDTCVEGLPDGHDSGIEVDGADAGADG